MVEQKSPNTSEGYMRIQAIHTVSIEGEPFWYTYNPDTAKEFGLTAEIRYTVTHKQGTSVTRRRVFIYRLEEAEALIAHWNRLNPTMWLYELIKEKEDAKAH